MKRNKSARTIFKNFRFGLSVGYGKTYFSHQLKDSFAIYQPAGKSPLLFQGASPDVRYLNWVNKVVVDSTAAASGVYIARSDTAKLGFKGKAFNIPIKATIHYEFLKRYRIGGGYSYEYMRLGEFRPISFSDTINTFQPSSSSGFMGKYFGMLGVSFYRIDNYLFTADLNIGGFKPSKNFDKSLIKKGIYVNLGVTAEREMSEYLRLFVRPSYDFKNYSLTIPGTGKSIKHNMNAFYINVGITYTIPELPRCYNKDCRIQINHAHGNKEYRSRVHPIYKKQNPGYGENNPMIKYKGKNKKKMNPY